MLLLLEKADAIVKLPHALRNLLRGLGLTQMGRRERDSVEELLEAAVDECAEQARSYLLPRQSSQDAELRLSVDEMLNLWSVDPQENLLGWPLSILTCQERLFGRRDHVDGVGQGTAEPLNRNGIAAVEWYLPPTLESQGVGQADDLILERSPSLLLLGLSSARHGRRIVGCSLATRVAQRLGVVEHPVAAGHEDIAVKVLGIGRLSTCEEGFGGLPVVFASGVRAETRNRSDAQLGHAVIDNPLETVEGGVARE